MCKQCLGLQVVWEIFEICENCFLWGLSKICHCLVCIMCYSKVLVMDYIFHTLIALYSASQKKGNRDCQVFFPVKANGS